MSLFVGLVFAVGPLTGAITRAWWSLAVPLVVLAVLFAAISLHLVGHGLGDAWPIALSFLVALSTGFTALAVFIARQVLRTRP